jgi:hypothetical protein
MKFSFSLALAAILITGTASAQHVNIGIKAGLNVSNINNDNGATYDSKAGLNLGLIGHIHLSKQWALQPELVYSGQGAKFTTAGVESKINLDYINVPLLLQYMFDNGFRIQAGPQVGFLVSAKNKTNSNSLDIKSNLKGTDVGLGMGIGYVKPSTGFGVDARYNFGLSNINENSEVKSLNRVFQIGVFYLFDHK